MRNFLGQHLTEERWVVASDYNTGTKGTDHDVYAFAIYPIPRTGLETVRCALRACFPRDFKHTAQITREQKRFPATSTCFSFVFLVSKSDSFLRSGDRDKDLAAFRYVLKQTIGHFGEDGIDKDRLRHLRMFLNEASKKDFSLALAERVLMLALFNAYVTAKLTANTPVKTVWWVTDNEGLTRYCHEVFRTLTYLNYHSLWTRMFGRKPMPQVGLTDLKGMDADLSTLVDDLIRIPDFFAAVLSRWQLANRAIKPPPGTKRPAVRRYFHILKYWLSENENLWLCNCRPEYGGDLRTGRVISAASPKRLERYRRRVAPNG